MEPKIAALIDQISELEKDLAAEFAKRRAELEYGLERGRVIFEQEILRRHKELRTDLLPYVMGARLSVVLSAPLIYALIVPLVLLDLMVTIYQAVCFPVYGITKVRRRDHIVIDRQHLVYLNGLQKLNCVYCGYCNGLVSYVREIAGRTEQYWCPIKHARRTSGPHRHYGDFVDYGDAEGFRDESERLRDRLRPRQ